MRDEKLQTVLDERIKTHGDFREQFIAAQNIKAIIYAFDKHGVCPEMREALDQIAHKLSRIVTGNPNHADHWRDIAGYATLIANMLETE